MSPEAQRIAIAEACPDNIRSTRENDAQILGGYLRWQWRPDADHAWRTCYLNDPLNDLNAMHEAEKVLTNEYWPVYALWLDGISGGRWQMIHSTAAQRAEAFLQTLGLWKEEDACPERMEAHG